MPFVTVWRAESNPALQMCSESTREREREMPGNEHLGPGLKTLSLSTGLSPRTWTLPQPLGLALPGPSAEAHLQGVAMGTRRPHLSPGSIIIFLSLFWWVFWYTGNVEAPPDHSLLTNKRLQMRSSSYLQTLRNSISHSLPFTVPRLPKRTHSKSPFPLTLKMVDTSQPETPQTGSLHPESLHSEILQPEDLQSEDLQPENRQPEILQPESVQPEILQPESSQSGDLQPENSPQESPQTKKPQSENLLPENSRSESSLWIKCEPVLITKESSFPNLEKPPTEKLQDSQTFQL